MPESTPKGGRKPRVSDEDLLDVFRATTDPVLSTAEVAERVPIKRRGVLNRLRALEEDGHLSSKQIGGRNTVWWLVDDGKTSGETSDEPTTSPPPAEEGAAGRQESVATAEEQLRAADLPGQGGKLDARIEAVLRMYELLQANAGDAVSKTALLDHVDAEEVGYASLDSFWNNFVKANTSQGRDTNALEVLPGVKDWGGGEYRYTEPEGGEHGTP